MRGSGMRRALSLVIFCSLTLTLFAVDTGGDNIRKPLDLPRGLGTAEEEEDFPEAITFYGLEIEGQSFHFCFVAFDS